MIGRVSGVNAGKAEHFRIAADAEVLADVEGVFSTPPTMKAGGCRCPGWRRCSAR